MKNKFQSMVAYAPIAEPCAAKTPQNTGGGNSQCSVLQYESALLIPTVNRRSTDGQSQSNYPLNTLKKAWKYVACMLMVLFMGIGQMWATDIVMETNAIPSTKGIPVAGTNGIYYTRGGGAGKKVTVSSKDYVSVKEEGFVFTLATESEITINTVRSSGTSTWSTFQFYFVGGDTLVELYQCALANNKKLSEELITWKDSTGKKKEFYTNLDITSASDGNNKILTGQTTGKFPGAKDINNKTFSKSSSLGTASTSLGTYAAGTYLMYFFMGDDGLGLANVTLTPSTPSTVAPTISAPTADQSATYTVGNEIAALSITASGTPTPTYQWYSNNSASTTGATSLGASAQSASYTPSNAAASDLYYYCVVTNSAGSATSHYFHVTVSASSAPTHAISYNEESLKGQSVSGYPTEYTEGVGIASFDDLADVTNFHFNGWSPASISASATTDVELTATWVAAYNVTFDKNGATGTAPDAFQKWQGAKFNLPGQGSMTAPGGKVFDGWKAGGTKYAENAEYTMGNAAVEFVAQWKAVPQTIFHWRADAGTTTTDAANGTTTGGTVTLRSKTTDAWGTESVTYNASVAADMKATSTNEMKSGKNAVYLELALTSGTFQEDDTIYVTGYNTWGFSTSNSFTSWDVDSIVTGATGKGDVKTGYGIIKPGVNAAKIYVRRGIGNGSGIAAIKVIRPAARDIASTVITLSDVKVNNHSISSDSLAILTANPYTLTLKDEFVTAPEIKFNEHKVITYADELLPATKVTDKVYTVTATLVDGNWQAQQTIDSKTYTVKAPKQSSAKVTYYDDETKIGEETVGIGGNPAEYLSHQGKDYATFVAWYNNSDLAEEHKIADISAFEVTEAIKVYGKWDPAYATSINIEKWVLDNGVSNSPFRAKLTELNYKYETLNNLDSLNDDPSKDYRNYAYLGQKVNKTVSEISFLLKSGSTLKVRFGHLGSTINVVYGTDDPIELTSAEYANESPAGDKVYEYTATADVIVKFQCTGTNTSVFKQIMIDEAIADVALPYLVTFNAGTGTCATAKLAGASVTLPAVTAPEDYTFAGWFDEATGGANKGLAGATYVPTDNVTLYAHFDPVKYTITYEAGLGSGEMEAAEAGWGTEYIALKNGFTAPTGYIFAGWTVTGVDGVSSIGNLGSFTMPKGNVTLTAIWEDNSKVAMNVETSEKYATLAEAIAAAEAGQTVQLMQNVAQADGVLIDKDLVLDLNGKTYTCTNGNSYNNRAIKVTAGDVTIKNGTVDALSNDAHTDGCYGGLRIEGGNVTCEEVTFKNYRIYGLGLKVTGGHLELNECTVISEIGGGLEVAGGTAEVNNCIFTQTGLDTTHKWISTCLASSEAGLLTVNGGTYTSEYSSLYIYSTGGDIDVEAGSFTGDVVLTTETTPAAPSVINIKGGDFTNFEVKTPASSNCDINISGGTFDAPVENKYCADGYVPAPEVTPGVYTVEPKDGIEIIGVVTTGGTNKTVSGLYKGDASVNLDSNKKLGGDRYIYVTLASGYTFEETDVLVVDVLTMSDLTATKNLEITTGVGNINGEVWKSLTGDEYAAGLVTIPLKGIAEGQTSIGLKRSANQNAYINGLKVYRPMNPILTAITINGVACDKGEGNTFSITLPEEGTNLASLEVVPTVIRNAAHATTPEAVISNSGAWKAGDNTYRVMDKDGDYTDYTITITLQGEAPAPVITTDLADVAYCAGSEPTLTVVATGDELHYAWYKKGDTDTQVGADQNTYTVAGAGTYYVIVTNKVTGKLDASTTSNNAVITLNAAAAITTQPSDLKKQTEGEDITLSVVATGATGYQWYRCDNKEKENATAITGADEKDYTFPAAAGFFYCQVIGACGNVESNVAEVTVKRTAGCQYITATSGLNATLADGLKLYAAESDGKQSTSGTSFATASSNVKGLDAGAVGSINKQYILVQFPVDVEEFTIYGYNSSNRYFNNLRVNDHIGTTNADKFTSDMELSNQVVTKTNAKDGDEISMTAELNVPIAKENYVWIKFNSALEIYRICYTAAIEKPVIATQPATKIDFAAGDMTATVVVNAVTEGTLKYQWYNADGDVAVEGATSATLTTTEEGTYYVIVRNTLAGHKDYAVKSSEATLAYRQMNDATLSALSVSAGALDPAFDKAVVEYRVDLAKGTTTVPTLTATATMAAYGATDVVTNAAEFENYEAISTVLVTAEDGVSKKTYTVHYYVAHAVTTLADVTENTTWDWSLVTKKADGTTISGDGPKLNENEDGLILANYLSGDDFDKLEGNDDAYAIRNSSDKKVYQGASLRMHTTKGGYLSIWAANEGHTMTLNVTNAGRDMELATLTGSQVEYKLYVQAGDVRIYNVSSASKPMRVSKIVFTVDETPNYTRDVTNNIGTLCVDHNVLVGGALGATFYQIASRNETYPDKIDFEEVLPGEELKAGQPYIFRSNTGKIELFYGDSVANYPVAVRGMIGNYAASTLAITEANKSDILYIAQNKLWMCGNLVGGELILNDHRAYIKMSDVPTYEAYEASKQQQTNGAARRRVTLGMNSTNVATGLEDVQGDHVQATKVLIDGQLYIMYNGTMYNVQGKLVK